jgi:hypothetical protein
MRQVYLPEHVQPPLQLGAIQGASHAGIEHPTRPKLPSAAEIEAEESLLGEVHADSAGHEAFVRLI